LVLIISTLKFHLNDKRLSLTHSVLKGDTADSRSACSRVNYNYDNESYKRLISMVKLLPATRSAKYKSVCMFVQVAAFPSNC